MRLTEEWIWLPLDLNILDTLIKDPWFCLLKPGKNGWLPLWRASKGLIRVSLWHLLKYLNAALYNLKVSFPKYKFSRYRLRHPWRGGSSIRFQRSCRWYDFHFGSSTFKGAECKACKNKDPTLFRSEKPCEMARRSRTSFISTLWTREKRGSRLRVTTPTRWCLSSSCWPREKVGNFIKYSFKNIFDKMKTKDNIWNFVYQLFG